MDKAELWKISDGILEEAIKIKVLEGLVPPSFFMMKSGQITAMEVPMSNLVEKEISASIIHAIASRLEPEAVLMVGEAWIVTRSTSAENSSVPDEKFVVSEQPDRRECIMLSARAYGVDFMRTVTFTEKDNGEVEFDPEFETSDQTGMIYNQFFDGLFEEPMSSMSVH